MLILCVIQLSLSDSDGHGVNHRWLLRGLLNLVSELVDACNLTVGHLIRLCSLLLLNLGLNSLLLLLLLN